MKEKESRMRDNAEGCSVWKCHFDLCIIPKKEQYSEEQFNAIEDLPSTQ